MTFDKFDIVFYTFAFVVPGFILHTVLSAIVPRKSEEMEVSFLRYFVLSCFNYALWSWLVYLLLHVRFFSMHSVYASFCWFLIILISPLVLGIVIGSQSRKDNVRKALHRVGVNTMHGVPNSWDYKFSTMGPSWVLVRLKDGSLVRGYFGKKSFASSDSSERDIYIEKVYSEKGGTSWECVPRSAGIYIKADEIRYIEFIYD